MYDVVVVGARCAGAPLAMLLARAGRKVALLDRSTFPSDTMSTHFLWPRGVARLAGWGLLDQLHASGCDPITTIAFDVGPVRLHGTGPAVDGIADSFCPRRTVLDNLLVDAAMAAGAELIDHFVVDELTWSEGRVAGVVGHHRGSDTPSSLTGRVVVGADGLHSTVATRAGAQLYRYEPPQTCVYYSYWRGITDRSAVFYTRPDQLTLVWPTNDELTCVYVAWPVKEFARVKQNVEHAFHAAAGQVPRFAEALAAAERVQPITGTRALPNQYRASAGPGWALTGDAGHHKDPCTGMGMSDAFASADLLAARLTGDLDNPCMLDAALIAYQQDRDAVTANGFDLTVKTARLAPITRRLDAFYRAAADRPDIVDRIFGVLGGTIPASAVYSDQQIDELVMRPRS